MPAITTEAERKIIEDFAKLIQEKKTKGAKPEKDVINFRDEKRLGQGHNVVEPAGIQRATAITHRDWIAGALHVGGNSEPRTCG